MAQKKQDRRRWRDSQGAMWFLEPALLLLLHHRTAHGYTLIDHLAEYDLQHLHPSVVYRTLREMEAHGWVDSAWDMEGGSGSPRRVYRLTASGDAVLRTYIEDMEQAHARIVDLIQAYHRHIEEGEGEYH
jgi:PadR family transcriptional regulator, regulatory protein PadR